MELTSRILSRDDYLQAVSGIIDFMAGAGVRDVLVAYGFGCDCPDDQLYQDFPMALDRLQSFIEEAERLDYYRVGKDNLHIKAGTKRIEFLLCHESDIHVISEDNKIVDRLKARWLMEGFCGDSGHLGSGS